MKLHFRRIRFARSDASDKKLVPDQSDRFEGPVPSRSLINHSFSFYRNICFAGDYAHVTQLVFEARH